MSVGIGIALGGVFSRLADESDPIKRVQRTVNFLMLLAVPSFWFGCNTAAKELVKERVIYLRERDFNLRVSGYYLSKFLVLALGGTIQVTLLFGIAWLWCRPPGPPAVQWATLVFLTLTGTSIGLLISAYAKTEEMATTLVPLVVLPQIIMAGVVVPLKGIGLSFSKCMITVYWGQQALEHTLPKTDLELIQRKMGEWTGDWTMILVHAVVAAIGTMALLHWTGRKTRG